MENENVPSVKTGDWVLTLFITWLPLIGIIMLFVWAFSGGTHPSKASWAKAMLIWMLIGIVLAILFWGVIASILGSIAN